MRIGPSIVAVTLLAAACGLTSCSSEASASAPAEALRVHRGDLLQHFVLTGELAANRNDTIAVPRMEQWQTSIRWLIDDGTMVKKGDKVAELDSTSITSTLDQKRAALVEARHQLNDLLSRADADLDEKRFELEHKRADLEKARINAQVPPEILAAKEARDRALALQRAENEYEKALLTLDSATRGSKADLENLRIAAASAERDVAVAESSLEQLNLYSPEDGLVLLADIPWEGRRLQVGDRVFVGFPIAHIPDLSSIQVNAMLWDVDDGRVKVGEEGDITVDAVPQRTFKGRVVSIAPVAQEQTRQSLRRAFRVTLALQQSDPALRRPGYSVRVTFQRPTRRNVLLAPRTALEQQTKTRLHLADGTWKEVRLGPCSLNDCVIEAGAEDGMKLSSASKEVAQ